MAYMSLCSDSNKHQYDKVFHLDRANENAKCNPDFPQNRYTLYVIDLYVDSLHLSLTVTAPFDNNYKQHMIVINVMNHAIEINGSGL